MNRLGYPIKRMNLRASLACAFFVAAGVLQAQETSPSTPDDAAPEDTPPRLTGDWSGARTRLDDSGIRPAATLKAEYLANADGGVETGGVANVLLDVGVEFDLETLAGWTDGSFVINAFAFAGSDPGEYVGDNNGVSNIYTDTELNVFNIYVKQRFGERWVKLGQIALDDDFYGSDGAGHFVNSAFGPLTTESGNLGAPIYPLAAPGAAAFIQPGESWFVQVGVYAGDVGRVESGNHGFDWELDGELGWVWIVELGYEYEGGVAKIGAYHSTGGQSDFATGEEVDGLSSLYAIIDRRIFGGEKGFGASVFLRGSVVGDSDRAVVESAGDAGIVFSNVVRAGDCLGFAVSLTNFGDAYVAATRAEDSYASDSETVVEATYEFPLMPGWILQPDIQYVIDPHASGEDVLVLGLRTVMEF